MQCFVEVDYNNELVLPSNEIGEKMLVLYLESCMASDINPSIKKENLLR